MTELYLQVLDWTGAFFIIVGLLLLNSKLANNPKIRARGSILVIIGCISLTILALILWIPGTMTTQIGVIATSLWGIWNCHKLIKQGLWDATTFKCEQCNTQVMVYPKELKHFHGAECCICKNKGIESYFVEL